MNFRLLLTIAFITALTACGGAEERKAVYMEKAKSSIEAVPPDSTKPKELLDKPTTFTSVVISVFAKALFVNAVRFTVNGEILDGASTTLET